MIMRCMLVITGDKLCGGGKEGKQEGGGFQGERGEEDEGGHVISYQCPRCCCCVY